MKGQGKANPADAAFQPYRDPNNTRHPQLPAGTTAQALAKVYKKTSGPSGQPGRQRGEHGPQAGSRRKQGGCRLPSSTHHRSRVVAAGRRSGKSSPVAVHTGGTLDPQKHKEGIFTALKSAAYSFLF